MKTVLSIIGIIAIIYCIIFILAHICLWAYHKLTDYDCKYISIKRDSYIGFQHEHNFYVIPSLILSKHDEYFEVYINWLLFELSFSYYLLTDEEEELYADFTLNQRTKK